jgi:hypothetical protein
MERLGGTSAPRSHILLRMADWLHMTSGFNTTTGGIPLPRVISPWIDPGAPVLSIFSAVALTT